MLISSELFLDCILYIINENTDTSRNLVSKLISIFETDSRNHSTPEHEVARFYIRILKTLIETKISKQNHDELRIILLKFQSDSILSKRGEIYKLLYETFTSSDVMSPNKIERYAKQIHNALRWHHCNKAARTFYGTLARAGDMVNPDDHVEEMRRLLMISKEIDKAFSDEVQVSEIKNTSLVEQINFTDKSSMKVALEKHQDRSIRGILKLGLQGLNRMCGKRGGFARGEAIVFYALPHHYKSGLIMSTVAWVALYNEPIITRENKELKPFILLISLENEAYQNFVWMFRHFYETQNLIKSDHLTDDQVADWTYDEFNKKGYTLIIERHDPLKFGFAEYVATVEKYQNSGYDVVISAIDYINLMSKTSISSEASIRHDLAVRVLFSSICNYTKTQGITFVSAHPLHRRAQEIATSGVVNVVKRLETSHLSDSFDVAKEVDLEIFIHIERNLEGTSYLTMKRGKHRYVDDTPIAHQYCAYRFHPVFGIRDDLLNEPAYVQDIYSDPLSSQGDRGTPKQPNEMDLNTMSAF